MIKRYILLYLIVILHSNLFPTEIELNSVKEIIASNHKNINHWQIKNLQIAPFNENLMSFEVTEDDKVIKLFLYNIETEKTFQIESANYAKSKKNKKSKKRYYLKDRGLNWHPVEPWFAFYGNGYNNRDQIFLCKVLVPQLINSFSVKGFRANIREKKGIGSYYKSPCFNSTGDKMFFSRKIRKKDKKARYNKTSNITYIENILNYESNKFKGIEFEVLIDKKFNQKHPVCSPTDPDLVAYVSYKNTKKRGEDYYADYSLNIINARTGKITVVERMDGYKDRTFQWSPSGQYLYYYKALSLLMTEQSFIDDKENLLNLKFAKITKDGNTVKAFIQSNPKTDILLKDVTGKKNNIAFINETNILATRYDPNNVITHIDIRKWKSVEKKYATNLEFSNMVDSPMLMGNTLLFISYEEKGGQPIDVVSASELKITLSEGESRDYASGSDSAVEAQTEDHQNKITKLNADLDKIEKDIAAEQSILDKDNTEFTDLSDEKESLIKSKDSEIALRNDFRTKQSTSLEGEQEISKLITQKAEIETNISEELSIVETENENITKLQTQISSLKKEKKDLSALIVEYKGKSSERAKKGQELTTYNDKIKTAKDEITKIENSISTLNKEVESESLIKSNFEKDIASKNTEKAKFLGAIDNLKIEKAKTLESEGMLASFKSQLDGLKTKSTNIHSEINTLESELSKEKTNLTSSIETLSLKEKEKTGLLSSIDKFKKDKLASLSKDKNAKIAALQTQLAESKVKLEKANDKLEMFTTLVAEKNTNLEVDRKSKKSKNDEKLALIKKIENLKSAKTQAKKDDSLAKQKKEEADAFAKKQIKEEQAKKDKEIADLAAKKKKEDTLAQLKKEEADALEKKQAEKDKEAAELLVKQEKEAEELANTEEEKEDDYVDEDEYSDDEYSDDEYSDDEYSDDEEDYFDNNTTIPTEKTGSTRRRR